MKPLTLSVLLITIGSMGFALTQAQPAEKNLLVLEPPVTQKQEATTEYSQNIKKGQPPQVVEMSPESAIVKALNAFVDEEQTRRRKEKANEERWWPPTASWAIVYVTVV